MKFEVANFSHIRLKMAQCRASPVFQAIKNNDITVLQKLIDKNEPTNITNERGYTPLHCAIDNDSQLIVAMLVKQADVEIDARTVMGYSGLALACTKCEPNLVIIKLLLDFKANLNTGNKNGLTPLHIACKLKQFDVVRILLDYGAFINCQDSSLYTPLHYALEQNSLCIVNLLLDHNADANIQEKYGLNSLMFALVFAEKCVQVIIPHITNVNAIATDNKSTLALACQKQNKPIVKKLLALGSAVSLDLTESSPFMISIMQRNLDVFKIIWNTVKSELHTKNCDFMYAFIQSWGLNVEPYAYLLKTPGLNLLDCKTEIFKHLMLKHIYDFDRYKPNLFRIMTLFLDYKIRITGGDILFCIRYYKDWKYAPDLIKLVLMKNHPNYVQSYVLLAIIYSERMATDLLTYCPSVNPAIFFKFLSYRMGLQNFQFILNYFTPKCSDRQCILGRIEHEPEYAEVTTILKRNKVASLKELCRDVIRANLIKETESNRDFHDAIEKLEVPVDIKDILLYRHPLYNHFKNN